MRRRRPSGRALALVLIPIALGVLWWATARSSGPWTAIEVLPRGSTTAVVAFRRLGPSVAPLLAPWVGPLVDEASNADAWRAAGLDPEGSAALSLDVNLMRSPEGASMAIILPVTDREALWRTMARGTGEPLKRRNLGPIEVVRSGSLALLAGDRLGHLVVVPFEAAGPPPPDLILGLKTLLAADDDAITEHRTFNLAQPAAAQAGHAPEALAWIDVARLGRGLANGRLTDAFIPRFAEHYGRLFPALTLALTPNQGRLILHAEAEGQEVLRGLFGQPPAPGSTLGEWLPDDGWAAVSLTLNLKEGLEAFRDLVPPTAPTATRMQMALLSTAVGAALGMSWETVIAPLNGRLTWAAPVAQAAHGPSPGTTPIWLLTAGVADEALARTTLDRLTEGGPTGRLQATPTEFKGAQGWTLPRSSGRPGPPRALALVGDQVMLASDAATLEAALQRHAEAESTWARQPAGLHLATEATLVGVADPAEADPGVLPWLSPSAPGAPMAVHGQVGPAGLTLGLPAEGLAELDQPMSLTRLSGFLVWLFQ